MKRLILLLVLLSLAVSSFSVQAEGEYIGNMEVVNCNEWVSLREYPSTSAKRLVKVSLGSIVHSCYTHSDEWCYAEFDGYSGYILSKYLEPSEGRITFSAMLTANCEYGAEIYPTINSETVLDKISPNTIVRNCRIQNNGRVYVEYGGRCGFMEAEYLVSYSDLMHFPQKITLSANLYTPKYDASPSALYIDYTEGFYLTEYDYSEFVQEDAGITRAEFVLYSDSTVNNVHLFSVEVHSWDADTGEALIDANLEHIQYQVDSEHPLSVCAVIWGDMPNLAVGYEDASGVYHFTFVEISGEDGSLILREF